MINSPVEEVKARLDIVEVIGGYLRLQKAGRNYRAVCPFHSEKTPSFMVSPERQIWHCFGCSRGGDVFAFIKEIEGVEFGDALRILAQRAGVELKGGDPEISAALKTEKNQLYELCDLAGQFYIKQMESAAGGKILSYLLERGLKQKTIKEWKIGYAPAGWQALYDFLAKRGYSDQQISKTGLVVKSDRANKFYDRFRDRIMFPLFDINGSAVGFTGRENPANPDQRMGKYVNTPNTAIYDKSRLLYGLDKAKLEIRKKNLCLVVEGQMDAIMSHQAGVKNAVASSGTALTEYQLRIIKRYTDNLALAFDMDLAGETATKRGIDLSVQLGFNARVVSLPEGKDPAECAQKDVSLWQKAVEQSRGLMDFYVSSAFARYSPQKVEGKKEIAKIVLPMLSRIPNKIEQAHWLQEISAKLKVSESVLTEEMKKIKLTSDYPALPTEAIAVEKKSVNNNLEEHLLCLILANFGEVAKIKEESPEIFANAELREMFECLRRRLAKKNKIGKGLKFLPAKLASRANEMLLKFEAQKCFSPDCDWKKEIDVCLFELRKRRFRRQVGQKEQEMREAENRNDKKSRDKLIKESNLIIYQNK
jgi:DNA primase